MSDEITLTESSNVRFADLGLPQAILTALNELEYETPSPIQAASIPHLLQNQDLIGVAQTGTGKTAAFGLPALAQVDTTIKSPQVLVLVPTRELALQVTEAFQKFSKHLKGIKTLSIYGGQSMSVQLQALRRGVHIVVGTPGRVMDHLRRKTLVLDQLKTLVLDEADEMLRMGFIDDVTWILEKTPEHKQVALFSATMPKPIRRVADSHLKNPEEVRIASKAENQAKIDQRFWVSQGSASKRAAMLRFLAVEPFDAVMMFVRTKAQTVELAELLEQYGYRAAAIHGDLTQKMREHSIAQLKRGDIDIMVATDVAARGIDVARIGLVLNFDAPFDAESYVHRIGRTGRAGREGKAIIFLEPKEKRLINSLERASKGLLSPIELPSEEAIQSKQLNNFKAKLATALEEPATPFSDKVISHFLEQESTCPQQLAAALVSLAQGNRMELPPMPAPRKGRESRKASDNGRQQRNGNDKPRRERRKPSDDLTAMVSYRLSVGKRHRVGAGDIVGAIANEANIDSANIGKIQLYDTYSTVDLPEGMPKSTFQHLKRVRVRNQPLNLEPATKSGSERKR